MSRVSSCALVAWRYHNDTTMADVLIHDVEEQMLEKLRARAARNGRSLEAELHSIIERAAATDVIEARALAAKIRQELSGRSHSDSTELIAEDRGR